MGFSLEWIVAVGRWGKYHRPNVPYTTFEFSVTAQVVGGIAYLSAGSASEKMPVLFYREILEEFLKHRHIKAVQWVRVRADGALHPVKIDLESIRARRGKKSKNS